MTAQEVREYRGTSKKLVEAEERNKLLKDLLRSKVCLGEEEKFIMKSQAKFKVLGNNKEVLKTKHEEMVKLNLKYKIKDNILYGVMLRKRKEYLRKQLESILGMKSKEYRRVVGEVKQFCVKYRERLKKKHKKKVLHLVRKFGVKKERDDWKELPDDDRALMGNPGMFNDARSMEKEDVKDPILVNGEGENLVLSENEQELLKLGPKFCLLKNLCEEEFETDLEEAIMKVKLDLMGDEGKEDPWLEDVALRVLLGEDVCREIDEEKEEEEELIEAERRSIFDWKKKTLNFGRRRATDLKGNSRVFFPKKARSVKEETSLQTLRDIMMTTFRLYSEEKCGEKGEQKMNLTRSQALGLKTLKKRVKEGEIVIIPTDKSGNLAVLSRKMYVESGMVHTRNDKEVGWEEVRDAQKELNGHVAMLIKVFRIGSHWDHGFRVRETMMGNNQAVCPLSLLYKDHKGWTSSRGTPPPTRPVAGGHLGINMHISEIVSDLLDPVVMLYEGGREIISTEDLLARLEILNYMNRAWTKTSYWMGMKEDEYVACQACSGRDDFVSGGGGLV